MPSLGTRIRRARERQGMKQDDLARAVHRSVRAVNDWENDRREPRNSLGLLEDVLGVRLDGDQPDAQPAPAVVTANQHILWVRRLWEIPDQEMPARVRLALIATLLREQDAPAEAADDRQRRGA